MKCKPTVSDIYSFIDRSAPFDTQCDWDNSGLLVGNPNHTVGKIGVVLDITCEAVEYARNNGIDLIVSHHPVIFKAADRFLAGNPAYELARHGISAICAHTPLDAARGGVNDTLAKVLGFNDVSRLCSEGEAAILRIAQVPETSGDELARLVAEKLSAGVRLADCKNKITKIALCGGSGGDFIPEVASVGCDAYITGDLAHHNFLDGLACGVTLIAAGHFETENPIVAVLAKSLSKEFDCKAVIIPASSPVKYYF